LDRSILKESEECFAENLPENAENGVSELILESSVVRLNLQLSSVTPGTVVRALILVIAHFLLFWLLVLRGKQSCSGRTGQKVGV